MICSRKKRLLTVGHSYVVALNRRLAHEMESSSAGRWEVTAAAPASFPGDLKRISLEKQIDETCGVSGVSPAKTSVDTGFTWCDRVDVCNRFTGIAGLVIRFASEGCFLGPIQRLVFVRHRRVGSLHQRSRKRRFMSHDTRSVRCRWAHSSSSSGSQRTSPPIRRPREPGG